MVRVTSAVAMATVCFFAVDSFGQAIGGTNAVGSTSMAVESEMIAYEAVGQIAQKIALANVSKTPILLGTPANLSAIAAYRQFEAASNELKNDYDKQEPGSVGGAISTYSLTDVLTPISTIAGILNTLKGTTTQSSNTFTPVDEVLYADLEKDFSAKFVIGPFPKDYETASKEISALFNKVYVARSNAIKRYGAVHPDPTDKTKVDPKYDATQSELKGLETVWSTYSTMMVGTSGANLQLGRALIAALNHTEFNVLSIANAAAGGGDRANTYFLLNVLVPAPHHSYNGGAVIAYTMRTSDGTYLNGGTLRLMYGYTKWRPPSLRSKDRDDYDNFQWEEKEPKPNEGKRRWWRY